MIIPSCYKPARNCSRTLALNIVQALSLADGISLYRKHKPDVIIVDLIKKKRPILYPPPSRA